MEVDVIIILMLVERVYCTQSTSYILHFNCYFCTTTYMYDADSHRSVRLKASFRIGRKVAVEVKQNLEDNIHKIS